MNWKKVILGEFNWKRILTSFIVIYISLILWAYFYSEKLIFPYNQSSYDKSLQGLEMLKASDGTPIATRFWQAQNQKQLILYFHGNYLDLGDLDAIAIKLNSFGYSVLAMDYRGYGLSEGLVTETNSYQDAQLLYDFAIEKGYNSNQIILLGRSVGSGVATELALHNKAQSLILVSPFVSAYRVMTKIPLLPFDKFNNYNKIAKIDIPLFIIHGTEDKIIRPWHSEDLYNEFQGKKQRHLVNGAGHNDIWFYDLDNIFKQYREFVK